MNDLYTALAVMLTLACAALALGLRLGHRLNPRPLAALALLSCGLVVCFASVLRDHLLLTRLVPSPAVIIYGNALPPAVAFLTGLAWRRIPGHPLRKWSLLLPLLLLCLYQSYGVLLTRPPPLDNRWKARVCLQTSPASCSAAAAATLLRAHGITSTEAEMADLCLTRPPGTSMHGLYRGLKRKAAPHGWDVQAFHGDLATLRNERGPVLLTVRLNRGANVDPRYEHHWGWTPGVGHTVVFYGFRPDGKIEVGDPSAGREQWRVRDLQVLWHGQGIRLVPRETTAGRPMRNSEAEMTRR